MWDCANERLCASSGESVVCYLKTVGGPEQELQCIRASYSCGCTVKMDCTSCTCGTADICPKIMNT